MKNNKPTFFLYLFIFSIFLLFTSCGDGMGGGNEIEENADYMKAHPECIIGTYHNYFTKGAVSYIQLKADSTFIHVFKFQDIVYADSGKWTYEYNNGQNDIYFNMKLKLQKGEGSDPNVIQADMPLLDCNELFCSEDNIKLDFFKVKPSNIN